MSMLPLKGSVQAVRASAALTGSYVASTAVTVDEHNFLGINVRYTKGDETSAELKVQVSTDGGSTWHDQVSETISSGIAEVDIYQRKYDTTGNYSHTVHPIKVPTSDSSDKGQVRVAVKATGGTPTGTMAVDLVTGYV